MKFKRQWVTLNSREGPWLSIRAETLGYLAVHPAASADGIGYYFVITHIPTGMRITHSYQKRECRQLIEDLNALGLDWNFTGSLLTDEVREKALPLLREFRGDGTYGMKVRP